MFSDPQFWVAVSFILFIAAIFNPVRKILTSSLDGQINEIKNKIDESENIKNEAQKTLSELKKREQEVEKEIKALSDNAASKIVGLEEQSKQKLKDQIEKRKILAENKIDQLVRDANVSIKNYISSTAINTTIHILNNNLTDEKKASLISESIKEMNSVLKN
ncbi:hypothetical protein OAJ12_00165 [Pelagibacteraceae bacterium]|nr:hypothetical protein [Pelagibacteraceae bacterium]